MLFINASEDFDKEKRQNKLNPEHIAKIVDTYQFRKEENRYSRQVSMEEIEKKGYNLNISRYVSTAKSEEIIDLKAVNDELIEIGKKTKEAADRHNQFLKELGLPTIS